MKKRERVGNARQGKNSTSRHDEEKQRARESSNGHERREQQKLVE